MSDPTSADTVRNAARGDREAFATLLDAGMQATYRLTLAITGNESDARDAAQETWISAWRHLRELKNETRFETWIRRIAVNAARMALRQRRVREVPLSVFASDQTIEARAEDSDQLRRALAKLKVDERAVLALFYLEDRSIADLAAILSVPEGTVKSRLNRARANLRTILEADHELG